MCCLKSYVSHSFVSLLCKIQINAKGIPSPSMQNWTLALRGSIWGIKMSEHVKKCILLSRSGGQGAEVHWASQCSLLPTTSGLLAAQQCNMWHLGRSLAQSNIFPHTNHFGPTLPSILFIQQIYSWFPKEVSLKHMMFVVWNQDINCSWLKEECIEQAALFNIFHKFCWNLSNCWTFRGSNSISGRQPAGVGKGTFCIRKQKVRSHHL